MAIQFTRNGRKAMLWAQVEAMRRGEPYVEAEHLLLGLLHGEDTGALRLLDRLQVDPVQVRGVPQAILSPEAAGTRTDSAQLSPVAKQIVQQARRETEETGDDYVGTPHLLLALLRGSEAGIESDETALNGVRALGLTYERAVAALQAGGALMEPEEPELSTAIHSVSGSATSSASLPRPGFLKGRSVCGVGDLSDDEITGLFELTREIKSGRKFTIGQGKTIALLFEKPSLRTKVTFTVGMTRLGGEHIYLSRDEIGLGTRESVPDAARGLSRWVDVIAARTFSDKTVRDLAAHGSIPVINALSDREHPCQAFADFYTILENRSSIKGAKVVFVGDGNNVAQSLMLLAPRLGAHFTLACPPGYEPDPEIVAETADLARRYGTTFEIVNDALAASDDADVLYTDVWTSMGQENESSRRCQEFAGFQINRDLIREAKEDVLVLHCLPAHRGMEITDDVLDGPHSGVFDQAENRLHVQQALLAAVL
jgi:ornithine carbamoyltransferase